MRTIASLEVDVIGEVLDRLKKKDIPHEVHTSTQDSGLEISDIVVDDSDYDRGCDVVEAWAKEQEIESRKRLSVYCKRCGCRDVVTVPHPELEYVYKCNGCGYEFPR
jgi:hypothetical protein